MRKPSRSTTKRTMSLVFSNKYASVKFLRGGGLSKLFAPSRPGITGQWLSKRKCCVAKGLSVTHSLGKRPLDHQRNSFIGVIE